MSKPLDRLSIPHPHSPLILGLAHNRMYSAMRAERGLAQSPSGAPSPLAEREQAAPCMPEPSRKGALVLASSLLAVLAQHRKRQQRRRYTR